MASSKPLRLKAMVAALKASTYQNFMNKVYDDAVNFTSLNKTDNNMCTTATLTTTLDPQFIDAVRVVAKALMVRDGQTTTLDIKQEMRRLHGRSVNIVQDDVSEAMDYLFHTEKEWDYVENGTFRTYMPKLSANVTAAPAATTSASPAAMPPVQVVTTNAVSAMAQLPNGNVLQGSISALTLTQLQALNGNIQVAYTKTAGVPSNYTLTNTVDRNKARSAYMKHAGVKHGDSRAMSLNTYIKRVVSKQ